MSATDSRKKKAVAIWLLIGVGMIIIQVVLGGITRLTGSGLSMTEWDPIMGFIPPLSHQQWQEAFAGYQQIAQFKYLNSHFTLSDFKFIFFWEWFHRLWARLLGVVFLIPFIYFLLKKYFLREMIVPMAILFLLGGLQGFIGWFMVQSGLNGTGLLNVSHIRLSIHFVSALILLCYALWFALKLLIPRDKLVHDSGTKRYFLMLTAILTIQLFYGAFMSGLHAALSAPTWPKINNAWIPSRLMVNNWVNNPINVQFVHRGIAYLLIVLVIYGVFKARNLAITKRSTLLKKAAIWPLVFLFIQVSLGVLTLFSVSHIVKGKFGLYETLAQAHQLIGMCLLLSFVIILYIIRRQKKVV